MQIFNSIEEWRKFRSSLNCQSLGFVPTMGNLHAGHASLYAISVQENELTAASIFINPTQFNRPDDFTHYPRTLEHDLALLEKNQVDFCLLPTEKEIYHDAYLYQVHENQLSLVLEGEHRPGHFTGVLTVVMKLLNLVQPNRAYFGEKDFQQCQLIRKMVDAFFMPVQIKLCPTIRESSGLAFSSRNNRLSPAQRIKAERFARLFHQNKPCQQIIQEIENEGIKVEYLTEYAGRRLAAILIDDIRLIDNYALSSEVLEV